MPCANQLVMMWSATPEPSKRSPSVEMMQREQDRCLAARRDQLPDHRHRRARHGRAADADRHAVLHKGRRLLQRHDLLAQAAVALRQILAQGAVRLNQFPIADAHAVALLAVPASFDARSLGVELLDQPVPLRQAVGDPVPERLRPAALEILDADALLLDPGVVAEIEDLAPQLVGELDDIVGRSRRQAGAEHFAGIDLVETGRRNACRGSSSRSLS